MNLFNKILGKEDVVQEAVVSSASSQMFNIQHNH